MSDRVGRGRILIIGLVGSVASSLMLLTLSMADVPAETTVASPLLGHPVVLLWLSAAVRFLLAVVGLLALPLLAMLGLLLVNKAERP